MKPTIGKFVGTGLNRKTAARPEHRPSTASPERTLGTQLNSIVRQSPEPFRNPAVGGNPLSRPVKRMGNVEGTPARGTQPRSVRATQKISSPMTQSEMNVATGHAANYKMKGLHAATSGFPTQGPRKAGNSHDAFKPGWQSRGR